MFIAETLTLKENFFSLFTVNTLIYLYKYFSPKTVKKQGIKKFHHFQFICNFYHETYSKQNIEKYFYFSRHSSIDNLPGIPLSWIFGPTEIRSSASALLESTRNRLAEGGVRNVEVRSLCRDELKGFLTLTISSSLLIHYEH